MLDNDCLPPSAYPDIAAIQWNCLLHEAGADIVANYSTETWNLKKKRSGGKLGSDEVKHSRFKEQTAQLMLNSCFYVRLYNGFIDCTAQTADSLKHRFFC